jgi:trans-aconitate methyltransferase
MSDPNPSEHTWDPRLYDGAHAFVYGAAADLVEVLAPVADERVLDLGCGTGHLTGKIAHTGATVYGIDSSPEMIAAARASFPSIRFDVADARTFRSSDGPFDAVFWNATLHWVRPPEDAVTTIVAALKPGGRLVAEFGGKGNVRYVRDAIATSLRALGIDPTGLSPWYFPSPGEYASLLESHGFDVRQVSSFPRTPALDGPIGLRNWVTMFGGAFMSAIPENKREQFFVGVEDAARPHLFHDGVWYADYRRIRVVAVKT